MKFRINGRTWEIIEISQEEIRQHIIDYKYDGPPSDGRYYGQTYFDEQKIYLDKGLNKEQKRQTLLHELMHCYIATYIALDIKEITEEILCDISANSHDIIHKIAEDYFMTQPTTLNVIIDKKELAETIKNSIKIE